MYGFALSGHSWHEFPNKSAVKPRSQSSFLDGSFSVSSSLDVLGSSESLDSFLAAFFDPFCLLAGSGPQQQRAQQMEKSRAKAGMAFSRSFFWLLGSAGATVPITSLYRPPARR